MSQVSLRGVNPICDIFPNFCVFFSDASPNNYHIIRLYHLAYLINLSKEILLLKNQEISKGRFISLTRKMETFLHLRLNKLFLHEQLALQSVTIRPSTGNDSSGQYFRSYFLILFPSVATLSHRGGAWIKILNLQKLIRAPNNLPFETPSAILCPLTNILNFAGGSMFLLGYQTLGSAFDKIQNGQNDRRGLESGLP